jgi:hypothetical protein
MGGDRGASLPVAALGVLAVFFSTVLLSQYAFDLLRLSEGESAQERSLLPPPVEARLWEDPLAALVRHKDVVDKQCSGKRPSAQCEQDGKLKARSPLPPADVLVVVPLPGSSFVGGEEQRRRIRYAVLAGLASKGFVHEHSSRLGLMTLPVCESLSGCDEVEARRTSSAGGPETPERTESKAPRPTLDIAYESLRTEEKEPGRRATVLWVDDTKLGKNWLAAITMLVGETHPASAPGSAPQVTIVGPYTSEKLADAIRNIATLEQKEGNFCTNWKRLKTFNLVSPFSTADEGALIKSAVLPDIKSAELTHITPIDCPDSGRPAQNKPAFDTLAEIFQALGLHVDHRSDPFFLRTVGSDSRQVGLLRSELCARGLRDGGRVVLLHEWDSLFARSLVEKIRQGLPCRGGRGVSVETYAYFGGLDGVTLEGASKQQRAVPRANRNDKDSGKEPEVEWPENRDQRDYIRRLVRDLQASGDPDAQAPVRAVGVIGQDVHDKLLLIQALRPSFTEQTIFTTDMDARLFHPDVTRYMRNVVVSSPLPLSPQELRSPVKPTANFAPFRDSYQTATYLAVRYAALNGANSEQARKERAEFREELARQLEVSYLHEVGRQNQGVAALAMPSGTLDGIWNEQVDTRLRFALVLSVLLAIFGLVVLVSMPSPALRKVVRRKEPSSVPTMLVASVVVASWGFAVGVVAELARPGRIGVWGVLGIAALAMAAFAIAFWRRPAATNAGRASQTNKSKPYRLRLAVVLLLPAGAACLLGFVPHRPPAGTFEPFSIFAGVSSWPSELLRAFAVLLFGWFLDRTWTGTLVATAKVGSRYFPGTQFREISREPFWRRLRHDAKIWIGLKTLTAGKDVLNPSNDPRPDGAIDGSQVWRNYLLRLADGPRFVRLVLWLAITWIVIRTIMMLAGGEPPDVPARGESDRDLFRLTIWLSVTATIILMILVSDATILTWRFIQVLRDKRTVYPSDTVQRFAADLGPKLSIRAKRTISAKPRDRNDMGRPERNSILDPWIDANLLADHTEGISKLIFFPLILLGLLFVARLQIFDNWSPNNVVMIVLVVFLLWMVGVATALNVGAEIARRRALEIMRLDLLWLKGSSDPDDVALAEQFPALIKQVEELRRGAFAPFFEQPLVRAVLVPLGGVGGLQLLELLTLVRS